MKYHLWIRGRSGSGIYWQRWRVYRFDTQDELHKNLVHFLIASNKAFWETCVTLGD